MKYITSSRNGSQFEEDMKRFLGDERLDVVLNSLSTWAPKSHQDSASLVDLSRS